MNLQQKKNAVYLLIALFLIAVPGQAQPPHKLCRDSQIYVIAEKNSERKRVCKAVRIGTAFLKLIGLDFSDKLTITLLKSLLPEGQVSALGQYDLRSHEIRLLNYEAVLGSPVQASPVFRSSMSPAIWRSYIIHELAHAAVQDNFVAGVSDRSASEYIAAVAQMATLTAADREEIIHNYPELSGFESKEEIASGYYRLDPSKFTVSAYLHFSRPENGLKFISGLLEKGLPDEQNQSARKGNMPWEFGKKTGL